MTVATWIDERSRQVPRALSERVRQMLGADADADVSRTTEVCLAAARLFLAGLIREQRFERNAALDLLAIDALMTFGYERAGEAADPASTAALARRGIEDIGRVTEHV